MAIDREKYGASEYANLLGVTPDNLRDWRRRGLRLGGVAVNGRVRYSDFDAVEGAVALHVFRTYAIELGEAYRISNWISPIIAERLGMSVEKEGLFAHFPLYDMPNAKTARFAFVPQNGNPLFTNDTSRLVDLDEAVGMFVNLDKLTQEIPDSVKAIAKAN